MQTIEGQRNLPGSLIYIPLENRGIKPSQITYTRLGRNKGAKRLWLEGLRLSEMGFNPGEKIRVHPIPEMMMATIDVGGVSNAKNTVSSRPKVGAIGGRVPIIDINSAMLEQVFGPADLIRVFYYKNRLVAQAHVNEMNKLTAIEDIKVNARAKRLTLGTIGSGGGIFCSAMKEGLGRVGIELEVSWAIDIENSYHQSALDNCPAIDSKTMIVEGDASDVETNLLTPINIFLISNSCTGMSVAGRAKNQLQNPEAHKDAGLMILKTIEIIEKYMPPVIYHENVVPFNTSASASLLVGKLQKLGYKIQSDVYGGEMGTLENRRRSILMAVHPDLDMDLSNLVPVMSKESRLSDVMEDVPENSEMWKSYSHLFEKEKRDIEAGKGFRMQILQGDEDKIGVMGAGLMKGRGTEPLFQHKTIKNLYRIPTPKEHAAFMKIPLELVNGRSKTIAHEILGQSGSYALVTAIGVATGKQLNHQFNGEPLNIGKDDLSKMLSSRQPPSIFSNDDDSMDDEDLSGMGTDNSPVNLNLF